MNRTAFNQNDVVRHERIASAANQIIALSGQKKDQLMKFVVMKIRVFRQRGIQMKQAKCFPQISAFFVSQRIHSESLLCAFFTQIIARFA